MPKQILHCKLSLSQKKEILDRLERNDTQERIANEYGINPSSVTRIKQSRLSIEAAIKHTSEELAEKKVRSSGSGGSFPLIDERLLIWHRHYANRMDISIASLQHMAQKFVSEFLNSHDNPFQVSSLSNFKVSVGWIQKWQKRHGVTSKTKHGEAASVDPNLIASGRSKLSSILSSYNPEDVYNADETGLYWRQGPVRTLHFKNISGKKLAKERLTFLFCTNATGTDKRIPLAIGKSENPRSFGCRRTWRFNGSINVQYTHQKSAWMNTQIWKEWLLSWDTELKHSGRKILLLYDNFSAHIQPENLQNIKMLALPPNTTSVLQPLDAGIICNFKAKYKKSLVQMWCDNCDDENFLSNLTIKEGVNLAAKCWDEVSSSTILKCFAKTGIFGAQTSILRSMSDPTSLSQDQKLDFQKLAGCLGNLNIQSEILSAEEFIDLEIQDENLRLDDEYDQQDRGFLISNGLPGNLRSESSHVTVAEDSGETSYWSDKILDIGFFQDQMVFTPRKKRCFEEAFNIMKEIKEKMH
jgi:DDE superfamily endonuclease/Tc5 transposase-like DNA-binding protein